MLDVLDAVSRDRAENFSAVTTNMASSAAGQKKGDDPHLVPMKRIPLMMQNLWKARLQQQTSVDVVADPFLWPLGQVVPGSVLILKGKHHMSGCVDDHNYGKLLHHAEADVSKTWTQTDGRYSVSWKRCKHSFATIAVAGPRLPYRSVWPQQGATILASSTPPELATKGPEARDGTGVHMMIL